MDVFGIFYQHFELCKHLNGHEFEQTSGDSEGQGSLACFSSCGCKESFMTQQMKTNNTIDV